MAASAMKTRNEIMEQAQLQEEQGLMKVRPKRQESAEAPRAEIIDKPAQVGKICDGLKPLIAQIADGMPDGRIADFLKKLPWQSVERVHVTQDGAYYSFAVEFERKKMIVTAGIGIDATTLTVSDTQGRTIGHAMQRGREISYYSAPAA